ncbi:MAG: coagulation factor 5/8 type domain-containing protein [Candidatus Eisenbacteria bacterium]|nr:coagulation factor 5/8 type domain-containing protein [Candidatus Eisenbacteria bacterium]
MCAASWPAVSRDRVDMRRLPNSVRMLGPFLLALVLQSAAAQPATETVVVDDFEDIAGWSAHPADGVSLKISGDEGFTGRALRLDVGIPGGGYAVVHKEVALELPENYAISFRLKGDMPPNHLELKLIDATGENVWWHVRRNMDFPDEWETIAVKKRRISFAWGPRGGGELRHAAAIEFAVTAGSGGAGSVWIDELLLHRLPPPDATPPEPVAEASSHAPGHAPALVLDDDPLTQWKAAGGDSAPWIGLDLRAWREFGGLTIHWAPGRHCRDYAVEASNDRAAWRVLRRVRNSNGGRDEIYAPESEGRFLRVRCLAGSPAVAGLTLRPLSWSASREDFFQAIAAAAPRGAYPRGMSGEQVFWTVAGADGDRREALLSEDGALELGRGGPSIEPFLARGDTLLTWAGAVTDQSLAEGYLPIPAVTRRCGGLSLDVTAFAAGERGSSSIVVRYQVTDLAADDAAISSASGHDVTLYLAVRPFQVNPPSQDLNIRGGTALIHSLRFENGIVHMNRNARIICAEDPDDFGAVTYDEGDVVAEHLLRGRLPQARSVQDPFGAASGALAYKLQPAAGAPGAVTLVIPLHDDAPLPPGDGAAAQEWTARRLDATRSAWLDHTGRFEIVVPPAARPVLESLKSQLGYILINRDGPAIQPGSRAYARSWIRDGALTATALLRLDHAGPVREFIEWYAPHQYANGKIPCVVDQRGADPVPEHDSSGEFVFLVAQYYRYTLDLDLARRMWPRVRRAAAYLDSLRHERLTAEYQQKDQGLYYGILPPSISHEGYAAKPVHSYWDDFFALRGFRDAAFLAGVLGHEEERERLEQIAGAFAFDFMASIRTAMRHHDIDYIPGSADLGDFDPTSTTIALSPLNVGHRLAHDALLRTFQRYDEFFTERRAEDDWDAYTPYEVRNIGVFVRLGWRDRAHELLDFFLEDQNPPGWRQWSEVVYRREREPRFLGDLPHTWVGSDFVRSVLDLFAYSAGDTLILAAGLPEEWLAGPGAAVRDLTTPFGRLSYSISTVEGVMKIWIDGEMEAPPADVIVRPPGVWPGQPAEINGRVATVGDRGLRVRSIPAQVRIEF